MTREELYAGLIKTPKDWWVCRSRRVFDAWEWPDGPLRDMVLSAAKESGVLRRLGPSSMTTAQAMAMAYRMAFGEEVSEEDALKGFQPNTERGYDFLHNRGEFAADEEEP